MDFSNDRMIIKPKIRSVTVGVFVIFIGVAFAILAWNLCFPVKKDNMAEIVLACLFVLLLIGIGIFAVFTNGKKLVIDSKGIFCKGVFSQSYIHWSDVRDYGLSYVGQTRWEGNTYALYFSESEQETKNEWKKKWKGKVIKVLVIGEEYEETVRKMIPFCQQCSGIIPFIPKDTCHVF